LIALGNSFDVAVASKNIFIILYDREKEKLKFGRQNVSRLMLQTTKFSVGLILRTTWWVIENSFWNMTTWSLE